MSKTLKYYKNNRYEYYAAALIVFAIGLRLLLAALGWPSTNSDEGTMGLMGLHIAYHGQYPSIYWGQNYMGVLEAYLAAFYFHLIGPSLFALRLSVITLITFFFVNMYLLTSLLYSKKMALVALALLSVGSAPELTRQIITTGGSAETLSLGSFVFLLTIWLALSYRPGASWQAKSRRLALYLLWGLAVGCGLWSDMVVLPTFAMAGLLLLVFCWRELLWSSLGMFVGIVIGALPLITYNLQVAGKDSNSVKILLGLFQGSQTQAPQTLHGLLHGLLSTILVSIPTATGSPVCPVLEVAAGPADTSPHSLACTIVHASWGGAYVILLAIALLFALRMLIRFRSTMATESFIDQRQSSVRKIAALILLGSAILSLSIYAISSGPQSWPGFHARYIIVVLIATPAIIAPLWHAATNHTSPTTWLERLLVFGSRSIIIATAILLLAGTAIVFSQVPIAQAANQQRDELIQHLSSIGATHIYTDYWTCDALAFEAQEHIICAVVDSNLSLSHNRSPYYVQIVSTDPHAAYVFHQSDPLPALLQRNSNHYRHYLFNGYIVYQPTS